MQQTQYEQNGQTVVLIESQVPVITAPGPALDLFMSIQYERGCRRIALNKEAFSKNFFILSTGLAGEVLQKIVNYRLKLAVYGDFSGYTSKPLQDFIRESNKGNSIFFATTAEEAVARLAAAR